jgi:hypothetical protein
MLSRRRLSCGIALWISLAASPPARAEILERVLAVIDGAPVLMSEVAVFARLKGLEPGIALEGTIDEILMFREAHRLPEANLSADEEARATEQLEGTLAGSASQTDVALLRRIARRQAAILKYVAFRFSPQIKIDEAAVSKAYAAEVAGRPGSAPLSAVFSEIESQLAARALDERIESWVRDLRSGARIRKNGAVVPVQAR